MRADSKLKRRHMDNGGWVNLDRGVAHRLLEASLANRHIRILAESRQTPQYAEGVRGAIAVGADIVESQEHRALRATIVNPRTDGTTMVAIERDPEFHGRVYKSPDDNAML